MKTSHVTLLFATLTLALAACGQHTPQAGSNPSAGTIIPNADYTQGVSVSGSTATIWFKSSVNTSWVDVHYRVNGGTQQNFRMTYNSASARYERTLTVASGNVITYNFTYNNGTPAYDTPQFSYTVGGTTNPPPTGTSGSIFSVAASSIPVPTGSGVMTFKVLNGTNGAYADSNIYWGVLGINPANGRWSYLDRNGVLQPISTALNDASNRLVKNGVNYANIYTRISEANWVSLPRITSGRMFLCVGSPCYIKTFDNGFAGPDINNPTDPNRNIYFDFIEFTVDATGYHGNTTRVDGFGFPIQHRLVNRAGNFDRTVGELESETRSGLFTKYQNEVPAEFKHLGTLQAPYRIVAPIFGNFKAGGSQANYFASYVNQYWTTTATKPTTQEIFLCNGNAANAAACAAVNRRIYHNPSAWNTPSQYYLAGPANYYARFWHDHSYNKLAYGFAYDDVNQQAAYLEVGDPKGLIVRVGW
ncbi:glycoside hydrolase family 64 protein [Deinococcus cellulosilyticus]